MSSARKTFEIVLSRKFSDGSLITCRVGTELEESDIDSKELADRVYNATMEDLIACAKKNAIVRSVFKGAKHAVKLEEKIDED